MDGIKHQNIIYEIFGYSNLTINIVQRMFKKSICLGVFKFFIFGNSKMSAMYDPQKNMLPRFGTTG